MKNFIATTAVALSLAAPMTFSTAAYAQTEDLSPTAIQAGCSADPAGCAALVQRAIAAAKAAGLPAAQLKAQIASIGAAVARVPSAALPPVARAQLVQAVEVVKTEPVIAADPVQVTALETVEQNISAGEEVSVETFAEVESGSAA